MTILKSSDDPARRAGTCQLCGGHGRALKVLVIADFIGWACEQCHRELAESLPRRFLPAAEETETSE